MKLLDHRDTDTWPFENLFYSREWLQALSDCYGFEFRCIAGEDNLPLLLFSIVEDIYGTRIISLPFSDYTEPAVGGKWPEVLGFLQNSYPRVPIMLKLHDDLDLSAFGFTKVRDAVCHRVPLAGTQEQMWIRTSHAFRKGVNKARKSGLMFETAGGKEGIDVFYSLLVKLRRDKYHILPQSKNFYLMLYERFIATGNGFVAIVKLDNRAIAAAIILQSGLMFFDKMGVSDHDFQEYRPNNLLLWEVMKCGQGQGIAALDMGLTQADNTGLTSFKKSLGAVPTAIGYHRYLPPGYDAAREEAIKKLLSDCTGYIINNVVSETQLDEASKMLYKYFC